MFGFSHPLTPTSIYPSNSIHSTQFATLSTYALKVLLAEYTVSIIRQALVDSAEAEARAVAALAAEAGRGIRFHEIDIRTKDNVRKQNFTRCRRRTSACHEITFARTYRCIVVVDTTMC